MSATHTPGPWRVTLTWRGKVQIHDFRDERRAVRFAADVRAGYADARIEVAAIAKAEGRS